MLRLLEGGPTAALTGEVACHLLGLAAADLRAPAQVLVRHDAVRAGGPHVVRSRRCPPGLLVEVDGRRWPVVPLARALADAVRATEDARARALVGSALSGGAVRREALVHELTAARGRPGRSAEVCADLAVGGVWSPPEGDLLDLVRCSTVLPVAQTNVLLVESSSGEVVCRPDLLLWPSALAAEVDSTAHHASAARWQADLHRSLDAEVLGLLVLHLLVDAVRRRGQQVLLVLERHSAARYPCGPPAGLRREPRAPVPVRGPRVRTLPRARQRAGSAPSPAPGRRPRAADSACPAEDRGQP